MHNTQKQSNNQSLKTKRAYKATMMKEEEEEIKVKMEQPVSTLVHPT